MATPNDLILYISHLSPYSYKAWAALAWSGLPFEIATQNMVTRYTVLQRLTGKTMVPVLRRGAWAINDSTQIARWLNRQGQRPQVPQQAPCEAALCWLLEELADEWASRWFIHTRWYDPRPDRAEIQAAIGAELVGGVPVLSEAVGRVAARAIRAQVARGGATADNARVMARAREVSLSRLEQVLASDETLPFALGDAPTIADFAWYGPLAQLQRDLGGHALAEAPATAAWLARVDALRLGRLPQVPAHPRRRPLDAMTPLLLELCEVYGPLLQANRLALPERAPVRVEIHGERLELPQASRYMLERQRWLHDELEQFLNHLPPGEPLAAPDLTAQLHTLRKDAQLALQRAPKGSGGEVLAD